MKCGYLQNLTFTIQNSVKFNGFCKTPVYLMQTSIRELQFWYLLLEQMQNKTRVADPDAIQNHMYK